MKTIQVSKILILFICFQIHAQESENPTVFKYEKTDEKIPLSGYKSVLNSSVFIKNENSAASNYSLVYDYIKSKYDGKTYGLHDVKWIPKDGRQDELFK